MITLHNTPFDGYLTVRSITVLKALNINTIDELLKATLPEIGSIVRHSNMFYPALYYKDYTDRELREFIHRYTTEIQFT
jgi:hypothetical protein